MANLITSRRLTGLVLPIVGLGLGILLASVVPGQADLRRGAAIALAAALALLLGLAKTSSA